MSRASISKGTVSTLVSTAGRRCDHASSGACSRLLSHDVGARKKTDATPAIPKMPTNDGIPATVQIFLRTERAAHPLLSVMLAIFDPLGTVRLYRAPGPVAGAGTLNADDRGARKVPSTNCRRAESNGAVAFGVDTRLYQWGCP